MPPIHLASAYRARYRTQLLPAIRSRLIPLRPTTCLASGVSPGCLRRPTSTTFFRTTTLTRPWPSIFPGTPTSIPTAATRIVTCKAMCGRIFPITALPPAAESLLGLQRSTFLAESDRVRGRRSSYNRFCMPNNDILRRQVGQLLILGYDGLAIDSKLRTTLSTLQPSGVILFARNIEEPQQTWRLLRDSQKTTRIPMFLCVDLEGGTVDRLKKVIAPAPSVQDVFATGNRKLFRMHGKILGLEARALGFNTDFAPVFDLGLEASRNVLTSRTASADPQQVILYAREFLRGLKASKVLGCSKHFPGLGEANLDSHHSMPTVHKSWKKMWAEDL